MTDISGYRKVSLEMFANSDQSRFDRVPGKLTGCEDNFAHLVWPFKGEIFL